MHIRHFLWWAHVYNGNNIEDDGKKKGKKNKDRAASSTTNGTTNGESKKKRARTDDGAATEAKEIKSNIGEYAASSYEPPSPPNKVIHRIVIMMFIVHWLIWVMDGDW